MCLSANFPLIIYLSVNLPLTVYNVPISQFSINHLSVTLPLIIYLFANLPLIIHLSVNLSTTATLKEQQKPDINPQFLKSLVEEKGRPASCLSIRPLPFSWRDLGGCAEHTPPTMLKLLT